jgi:energy-converting hydrogenase A subunit M
VAPAPELAARRRPKGATPPRETSGASSSDARDPTDPEPSDAGVRGMVAVVNTSSKVFYVVAASVLGAFSATLLIFAAYQLLASLVRAEGILNQTLQSIGLVTIAMAVFEVAKFLVEEELIRERQLRSVLEARRSLTKFFTIIVIVLSLEAIVLVFETKLEAISDLIYPTALMAVAVAAVIGLGLFQRLSAEGGTNRIGDDPGSPGPG